MPFAEIAAAIGGVKAAKDITKTLIDVSKGFEQAELRMKIIDLAAKLQDVTEELSELRLKLALREVMTFRDGVYWKDGDDEHPFCPRCFDVEGKAIHMHPDTPHWWDCKACKTSLKNQSNPLPPEKFYVLTAKP
jgi:hypothetical protein